LRFSELSRRASKYRIIKKQIYLKTINKALDKNVNQNQSKTQSLSAWNASHTQDLPGKPHRFQKHFSTSSRPSQEHPKSVHYKTVVSRNEVFLFLLLDQFSSVLNRKSLANSQKTPAQGEALDPQATDVQAKAFHVAKFSQALILPVAQLNDVA
jgi:hypothetical protein